MKAPQGVVALLACLMLTSFSPAQDKGADSLAQAGLVASMRDSLALGQLQLETAWNRNSKAQTDSLKRQVQLGLAAAWKSWAVNRAPRRGMSGEDILNLAELHAWLNRFDMSGCYNEQLECYKRAMVMPGTEERALRRLHAEYLAAGFAPGMIQTGQRLLDLDRATALEMGVGRSMAMAYYFVGDRKEAGRWIRIHLRKYPDDESALDLKRRIKRLRKQGS